MTLGEKIRKYRILKGKTQKQLGEEVGFKKSTADVRINQYETNKMAPKSDIRSAIADALDIDLAAISDISINSYEDIMYILFELEESLGMKIEKYDGRTYLSFDDNNKEIATLISYINLWKNQKTALLPDAENSTDEQLTNYQLWKSRFVTNIKEYYAAKESEIDNYYNQQITDAAKSIPYFKKTSELSLLFRKLIEAGFTVGTTFSNPFLPDSGPGFTFYVNELLSPPSKEAEKLFAQFRSELNHYASLGCQYYSELQMTDSLLSITYFIPIASFGVVKGQVNSVLDYYKKNGDENDFMRDNFELAFSSSLDTNYNHIEEEIELYKAQHQK